VNPETATEAVLLAANRLSISLPPGAAQALAAAAITHADDQFTVKQGVRREQWAEAGYRAYVRKNMQHKILEALIEAEVLPVTLPREQVTFHWEMCGDTSPPVPEDTPYDTVKITLRVQTRRARGVS
jgi:hypothetical protein